MIDGRSGAEHDTTPGYIPPITLDHDVIEQQAVIIRSLQAEIKDLIARVESLTTALAESESRRIADNNTNQAIIRDLQTRNDELTAQTSRNSKNSSQPPSADGYNKPEPRSLRPKNTGRKNGGQPGHPGTTLRQNDRPDQVISCHPEKCDGCGENLNNTLAVSYQRRQVVDLPPLQLVWIEYQLEQVVCPCCRHLNRGVAPTTVTRQVQYGPNLLALACYLYQCGVMSLSRVQQFCREAFDSTISQQVIIDASRQAATRLDQTFKPAAKQALAQAEWLHVDETGFKVDGRLTWLHSVSNPDWTWIEPHSKRGLQALKDISVLIVFAGVLIHDCWAAYDSDELVNIVFHQLCCSHLLRELDAVTEYWIRQGVDPGSAFIWSTQATSALQSIIHDRNTLDTNRQKFIHAALTATNYSMFPAGKLGQKHRALAQRIINRPDDYLYFATHTNIPPTNNPAEQEIRVVKIRQKNSGGMRTLTGTRHFTTIRSYISTARKHGITAYQAIHSLFTPAPWLPTPA